MEKFQLSNEYAVYRIKYEGEISTNDFIKRINQNKLILHKRTNKKVENRILIECNEFLSINNSFINALEKIDNNKIDKYAKLSWVYVQKKDFNMVMHKHDFLYYTTEKTNIKTDWTCVFYIQVPKNLKKGEGDIIFMTEDKKLHTFTPNQNDILIFSGKLNHMVSNIENAETDRIVYATNYNLNIR
jgi:hypothetical protein